MALFIDLDIPSLHVILDFISPIEKKTIIDPKYLLYVQFNQRTPHVTITHPRVQQDNPCLKLRDYVKRAKETGIKWSKEIRIGPPLFERKFS